MSEVKNPWLGGSLNEVLQFLKKNVYVKRYDLSLSTDDYLDEDLIGLNVLLDNGENTISNFTFYVNNEKYSTYSATTSETTMVTPGEVNAIEENK